MGTLRMMIASTVWIIAIQLIFTTFSVVGQSALPSKSSPTPFDLKSGKWLYHLTLDYKDMWEMRCCEKDTVCKAECYGISVDSCCQINCCKTNLVCDTIDYLSQGKNNFWTKLILKEGDVVNNDQIMFLEWSNYSRDCRGQRSSKGGPRPDGTLSEKGIFGIYIGDVDDQTVKINWDGRDWLLPRVIPGTISQDWIEDEYIKEILVATTSIGNDGLVSITLEWKRTYKICCTTLGPLYKKYSFKQCSESDECPGVFN